MLGKAHDWVESSIPSWGANGKQSINVSLILMFLSLFLFLPLFLKINGNKSVGTDFLKNPTLFAILEPLGEVPPQGKSPPRAGRSHLVHLCCGLCISFDNFFPSQWKSLQNVSEMMVFITEKSQTCAPSFHSVDVAVMSCRTSHLVMTLAEYQPAPAIYPAGGIVCCIFKSHAKVSDSPAS